jgi:hypothetical protein
MHMRRILLAFSFAASAASVAFADLVELNTNNASSDRIEQLTRTLSEGAYTESNDIDVPAETKMTVQLREKTVELNNASLAKKYGSESSAKSFSNNHLVLHDVPSYISIQASFRLDDRKALLLIAHR